MPQKGYFELYKAARPLLPAGSYVLGADHALRATPLNNAPGDLAVDGTDFTLKIISPRYTIPPNQILATFPPAAAVGDWRQRLPQIVFKRRTLPWERDPDSVNPVFNTDPDARPPYLALVVLAEGEGTLSGDAEIAKCVTPGTPMLDDADTATGKYLEVRQSIVDSIFPTVADLQLLAHVRKVNLEDTELALGDDDGYLSVVVSNRLPQPGPLDTSDPEHPRHASQKYTAYLINVEGQLHNLPTVEKSDPEFQLGLDFTVAEFMLEPPNEPIDVVTMKAGTSLHALLPKRAADALGSVAVERSTGKGIEMAASGFASGPVRNVAVSADDNAAAAKWLSGSLLSDVAELGGYLVLDPTYRFPVLTSWDFVCTDDGTFEFLMNGLHSGMLATEDELLDPALRPEITDTGHISLDHRTRRGEAAEAWYRGPMVPQPTVRAVPENGVLPLAHTGDQLRRVVPDGHEDLSLAAAFEIGRLLALSKPGVVAALARWRQELFGAARLQQLGEAFFDHIVAGFSAAAVAAPGSLDALIADRIVNHYTTGVIEQLTATSAFPVSRLPDVIEQTRPQQVLIGLGLDPSAVKEAVGLGGLAGLANLEVRTAEMSREPLSSSKVDLQLVHAALAARIDTLAAQAVGKDVQKGRRRRRDALDRMIQQAAAAVHEQEARS
jgi:hypothetical protein